MTPPSPGAAIRRARTRRKWSQQQLADALGVSLRAVNDWENGRAVPRMLGEVEEMLGIDLSGEPEERQPELPAIVRDNYADEAVRIIWSRERISSDTRLGIIAWYVSQRDIADRRNGSA